VSPPYPDRSIGGLQERYDAQLQVAHGAVQKEYVAVPAPLLDRTDELAPWFAASRAYVAALEPKPTKR
jgi:hypothetical protein